MNIVAISNMNLSDINPRQYGWENCVPGHSYGPAYRDHYLLHFVLSGRGCFTRKNISYALKSGDMFLIRPEELTYYEADNIDPWYYVWIGFDGKLCDRFLDKTPFSEDRCCAGVSYLSGTFLRLINEEQNEFSVCAAIYEIFAEIMRKTVGKGQDYVTAAVDYIRSNYSMPIKVEQIAEAIGIDRRYLNKLFLKATGKTPKQYLTDIRMDRAKSILNQEGCTVLEAARSVGYEDVFNFSKMFKKKFGIPPIKYKLPSRKIRDNNYELTI